MEEGGRLWGNCLRLGAQSALLINTLNINVKTILQDLILQSTELNKYLFSKYYITHENHNSKFTSMKHIKRNYT